MYQELTVEVFESLSKNKFYGLIGTNWAIGCGTCLEKSCFKQDLNYLSEIVNSVTYMHLGNTPFNFLYLFAGDDGLRG